MQEQLLPFLHFLFPQTSVLSALFHHARLKFLGIYPLYIFIQTEYHHR